MSIWDNVLPFTSNEMTDRECCDLILEAGQVSIRNVEADEEPFEYSASTPEVPFYGPGYILVKALPGWDKIFHPLINQLALKIAHGNLPAFDVICGNVSGGMIPAYVLKLYLSAIYGANPPVYLYAREMRKQHGSSEMLVGFEGNPNIKLGMEALDVEELVNQANTTCHAAETLRVSGLKCDYAATILDYQNPRAVAERARIGLTQISLVTLPTLLDVAEETKAFPGTAITSYRRFLRDPGQWQKDHAESINQVHQRQHPEYQG